MIVDLPSTTTAAVNKRMVQLRNDVGAMTLGRVLTLVIRRFWYPHPWWAGWAVGLWCYVCVLAGSGRRLCRIVQIR